MKLVHYSFISNAFPPVEGEDDELLNEGTYGLSLITWFLAQMKALGHEVDEPIAEDFGWYALLGGTQKEFGVACSVIHDADTGEQEGHLTLEMNEGEADPQAFETLVKHAEVLLKSHERIRDLELKD